MKLKYYFKKAQKEGWAIGQFNFSDSKTLEAIIQAARVMKAPIIIGTTEGESKSVGLAQVSALVKAYQAETGLTLFLNLDHGQSFLYIKKAVLAGYSAVHFDGSKLPLEQNIKETKKIVAYAKAFGVLVEGEVGAIGGTLTDPQDAQQFVKETKVDSLAVAVGSIHGVKSSLNLKRLAEIKEKVGQIPLVLHGGSGVPENDVKKAIELGVVKININTALRTAYSIGLKEILKKKQDKEPLYKYMDSVVQLVQAAVEDKIKLFGSANRL